MRRRHDGCFVVCVVRGRRGYTGALLIHDTRRVVGMHRRRVALTERVRLLEDVVDRVEDRVDRSDEVQRFTTSVLAARLTNGSR